MFLQNPTLRQIRRALAEAEKVNDGQRQRCVYFPAQHGNDLAARIRTSPHGLYQADGGGVANGYGWPAHTTVIGAAWGTYPDGNKIVRIEAHRLTTYSPRVTPLWTARAKLRDLLPAPFPEAATA